MQVLSANHDWRQRVTRSPACPNSAPAGISADAVKTESKTGLCGHCAWGFHTMDAPGHQTGEDPAGLRLRTATENGTAAGYRSECGDVTLYVDKDDRVGALREIEGKQRFFPGIGGNFAYERYLREHPAISAS
jgi:hypothetical protein